jgi:hypothetical protein
MGICPRCGAWVDEGEPYCPECCYMGEDDTVTIDGRDYDASDVERVLRDYCYNLEDLEYGRIDDEDMEEIIEALM